MKRELDEPFVADIAVALAAAENEGWPIPRYEIARMCIVTTPSTPRRASVPRSEYRLRLLHDGRAVQHGAPLPSWGSNPSSSTVRHRETNTVGFVRRSDVLAFIRNHCSSLASLKKP